MGHYFPVGCVRLGILKRWSSSPQTGVNLASQPQTIPLTQLFHSSSFLFFSLGESITRPVIPVCFLTDLFEFNSHLCPASDLLARFQTPSALNFSLSCLLPFVLLPACPFFYFFVSLCLFRAEVSAPQYQSVGHSGADQSVSGTGSFRGEGEKFTSWPGQVLQWCSLCSFCHCFNDNI